MTTRYFDTSIHVDKDNIQDDLTGGTLTNQVRVTYDDTLDTATLYTLINRIRDKILEREE